MHSTDTSILIILAVLILLFLSALIGLWKVFTKAGQPGWVILIPLLNVFVFTRIIGRPAWWLILFFIPGVNLAFNLVVSVDLATRFGRGILFGLGIGLFPFIFLPVLGFNDSEYEQPDLA